MRWIIGDDRRGVDMTECSDSLGPLVGRLRVHPSGYDWDGIVRDNVPGPYRPGSVDFILETEDSIDFIEFKGGDICKPHILENLRMKAARVGCDLSQEDLAQRVGVTRQTIGMIEAGRFNPSLALCVAICRALGKTLNDLFWEEDASDAEKEKAGA